MSLLRWARGLQEPGLVLVCGALRAPVGQIDTLSRLHQTIETFASVRHHLPNWRLVYVDSSSTATESGLNGELLPKLLTEYCDEVIDLTEDELILGTYDTARAWSLAGRSSSIGTLKSVGEAQSVARFFEFEKTQWPSYIKLSARYSMRPPRFDFEWSRVPDGSGFLVRRLRGSYLRPRVPDHPVFTRTVMWGVTGVGNRELELLFKSSVDGLLSLASSGSFVDIEHVFASSIQGKILAEFDKLGVQGQVASSGKLIKL